MDYFLAIQHTHHGIELSLFKGLTVLKTVTDEKKQASKNIVVLAQSLLRANDISFDDLSFFATNQGPGPFTTLRVVIATINGFGFATQKPLIGIDGLDALLSEYKDDIFSVTVALLNAYSRDLYFGIENTEKKSFIKGYENSDALFAHLNEQFPNQKIRFIGQGAHMYAQEIENTFKNRATIVQNIEACSTNQIGIMAWNKWKQEKSGAKQLFPLYLKSMQFKRKKPSHF